MNLTIQHPSPAFVAARALSEARLGCKLVKYFMDTPADHPTKQEIDALIAESERLCAGVAEARVALAKAFGDE